MSQASEPLHQSQPISPQIKGLCDVCDDVAPLFTSLDPPNENVILRTVADARKHLGCPLCALAVRLLDNQDSPAKGNRLSSTVEDHHFYITSTSLEDVSVTTLYLPHGRVVEGRFARFLCGLGNTVYSTGPSRPPCSWRRVDLFRHQVPQFIDVDNVKDWIHFCDCA